MGQLAQSMKASSSKSFLIDMEKNPKDSMAFTLRSGKELGDSKEVESETVEAKKEDARVEKNEEYKFTPRKILFPDNPSQITPPLLFPQRLKKANLDGQFEKFLNMFKKLEVNIPFKDVLA